MLYDLGLEAIEAVGVAGIVVGVIAQVVEPARSRIARRGPPVDTGARSRVEVGGLGVEAWHFGGVEGFFDRWRVAEALGGRVGLDAQANAEDDREDGPDLRVGARVPAFEAVVGSIVARRVGCSQPVEAHLRRVAPAGSRAQVEATAGESR